MFIPCVTGTDYKDMLVDVVIEQIAEDYGLHPACVLDCLHNSGNEQMYHDFNYFFVVGFEAAYEMMQKHLIPNIIETE